MTIRILLAEDSAFDARDFRNKIRAEGGDCEIVHARDGQFAVNMLAPASPGRIDPLPDVVVLDLAMPRMGGFEVLTYIRSTPGLDSLPVVMLTTSDSVLDSARALSLGADDYASKCSCAKRLAAMLRRAIRTRTGTQTAELPSETQF